MASLTDLIRSRLQCVRPTADGFQAQCPVCAASGRDQTGNHLHIWTRNGAFWCVVGSETPGHNAAVRAYLYDGVPPEALAAYQISIIDPEPKLEADKVFPEDMLSRMSQDHSYWVGRGISEDVLRRLEGGLVPRDPPGKLSGRYVFPIRCPSTKRIVGWTGRLVSDASFGPKWKHLVKAKRAIYPVVKVDAAIRRARKVVLVESPGDMLSLMTTGIDYALVLLGLNVNSRMLGYLASANLDEIIISTNSDTERVAPDGTVSHPGQDAAAKLRAKLIPYLGDHRVRVRLPGGGVKDWNEALLKAPTELATFKAELEGAPNPSTP
jgi:hypothetical protein